jgi:hypothetical protein
MRLKLILHKEGVRVWVYFCGSEYGPVAWSSKSGNEL